MTELDQVDVCLTILQNIELVDLVCICFDFLLDKPSDDTRTRVTRRSWPGLRETMVRTGQNTATQRETLVCIRKTAVLCHSITVYFEEGPN